jgi:MGT family glycosyltransferase
MGQYLLAATPLPGHVLPMLRIGQDLVRRGHQVRMLTGAPFADAAQTAGLAFVPLPPNSVAGSQSAGTPLCPVLMPPVLRRYLRGRADMRSLFVTPLTTQYRALTAALAAGDAARVDAVLVDVGFTGVLPLLLAADSRPPVLVFGVVPLMLSSADTAPFGMARRPAPDPADYRAMNWVVHRLLFGGTQARVSRALRELGVGPMPVFLSDWPRMADRLIQLTVPALEYPRRDLPDTVTFAGPVLPSPLSAPALPGWWPQLAGRRVVHVTQGTWDNADLGRLVAPSIRGLADDDVLVVVSTGGRPASAVPGPVPANVRIAEFLPYDALLPLVDVMVTNGGYGGVQHALAHGVPLVVAGDTADKPEVAARVAYSGSGIDLRTGTPTAGAVATAVRAVLADGAYRRHADRLRRDIAAARPLDTIADMLAALTDAETDR